MMLGCKLVSFFLVYSESTGVVLSETSLLQYISRYTFKVTEVDILDNDEDLDAFRSLAL